MDVVDLVEHSDGDFEVESKEEDVFASSSQKANSSPHRLDVSAIPLPPLSTPSPLPNLPSSSISSPQQSPIPTSVVLPSFALLQNDKATYETEEGIEKAVAMLRRIYPASEYIVEPLHALFEVILCCDPIPQLIHSKCSLLKISSVVWRVTKNLLIS